MEPTLVLLHSPFLGPLSWRPVAQELERHGRPAIVPSLLVVAESDAPYWPAGVEAVLRALAEAAPDAPVILVPHSNAGLYVPALVDRLGARVRGVVFVDAALPSTGHHTRPEFLQTLEIVGGRLPPWTAWWDEAEVAALFPSGEVRAAVEAEQPRMPVAYYDELPPAGPGWERISGAYLWFGKPYDAEARIAAGHGWVTRRLPGHHLFQLAEPEQVAEDVLELANGF